MSDARPPTQVALEPVRFTATSGALARFAGLFGLGQVASAGGGGGLPFAVAAFPMLFFSALKWRRVLPRRMALEELAAVFHGAFTTGDAPELTALVYPSLGGPGHMEMEFDLRHRDSKASVCSGSGVLGLAPAGLDGRELGFDSDAPLPIVRLTDRELPVPAWRYDQIERGQTAAFDFTPSLDALRLLHAVVLAGEPSHKPGWHEWIETLNPRPLLLAPVFASAAALVMPPRGVARARFEVEFKDPTPLGSACRIMSAVASKSDAPRALATQLTVTDTDLKCTFATASVHARVAEGAGA
jgi:hypothetical protein